MCVVPDCNKTLDSRNSILNHYYDRHCNDKYYICNLCSGIKSFRTLEGLKNHYVKTHPGQPIPPHVIDINKQLIMLEKNMKRMYAQSRLATPSQTVASTPQAAGNSTMCSLNVTVESFTKHGP